MPTPLEMEVMGPIDAHNGSGAVWQILVKSPKDIVVAEGLCRLKHDRCVYFEAEREVVERDE